MILRFLVFHGWLRWFVRLVGIAHGWWWLLPSSLLEDRDPLVFHVFLTGDGPSLHVAGSYSFVLGLSVWTMLVGLRALSLSCSCVTVSMYSK
jgi:hypothetical protein